MSKRGWPHIDEPLALGKRLKEARQRAELSQRQLSFTGCTAVYICRIEQGDRVPSLQVLRELARRLGVDEDWLATGQARSERPDLLLEADIALRLDQLELAEHLYEQVLEGAANAAERARALTGLGQIDFHGGRIDEAIERLEEARSLLGDAAVHPPAVAETLGRAYALRNEYESAIGVLERALEAARSRNDGPEEARFSVLLANALIDSGSLPAARKLLGDVLAGSFGGSDPILQARLYWSQSRLHSAEKNQEAASRYARMALAAIELTDHTVYAARAHHLLAYIELERGNAEEALELLERGHPLVLRSDDAHMQALFKIETARALAALRRNEEALPLAMEVAAAITETSPPDAGRAYAVAAGIFADQGDRGRALELYDLAADLLSERLPTYVIDVYSRMAELLEAEGRTDEALDVLKKAVGLRTAVEKGSNGGS